MYSIYNTDAFILESSGKREADKTFALFTEDFGRVSATAQGVRLMQSKLRPHLSDYSLSRVALVRGKETWRIVSAESQGFFPAGKNPSRTAFIRALRLLHRLVKGEEINIKLFTLLSKAHAYMISDLQGDEKTFETLLIIRILHLLGYVAPSKKFAPYILDNDFSAEYLTQFSPFVRGAIQSINTAIQESQL